MAQQRTLQNNIDTERWQNKVFFYIEVYNDGNRAKTDAQKDGRSKMQ